MAVVAIDVVPEAFHIDGKVGTNANLFRSPAVVVAIKAVFGKLMFACDACAFWQHNLYAIVSTMKSMRLVMQSGVAHADDNLYTPFASLSLCWEDPRLKQQHHRRQSGDQPSPRTATPLIEAAQFLSNHGGKPGKSIIDSPSIAKTAYRNAALKLHPDRGSEEVKFIRLTAAWNVVRAFHGIV